MKKSLLTSIGLATAMIFGASTAMAAPAIPATPAQPAHKAPTYQVVKTHKVVKKAPKKVKKQRVYKHKAKHTTVKKHLKAYPIAKR